MIQCTQHFYGNNNLCKIPHYSHSVKIKAQNILIDILLITTQSPHTSQSLRFVKWVERKTNIFLSSHTHKHTHAQILKCITITFSNLIFMVKSFLQKKRYKIQFSPDFLLKHQLQRWATQNPNKNKPLWRSHFLLCISKLKWALFLPSLQIHLFISNQIIRELAMQLEDISADLFPCSFSSKHAVYIR